MFCFVFFFQCTLLVSFVRHLLFSVLFLSSTGRMFSLFLSLFFVVLLASLAFCSHVSLSWKYIKLGAVQLNWHNWGGHLGTDLQLNSHLEK